MVVVVANRTGLRLIAACLALEDGITVANPQLWKGDLREECHGARCSGSNASRFRETEQSALEYCVMPHCRRDLVFRSLQDIFRHCLHALLSGGGQELQIFGGVLEISFMRCVMAETIACAAVPDFPPFS